ncbi:MAG: hypothetical protein ACHQO8_04130 [Vicinamibacterales bacterium]
MTRIAVGCALVVATELTAGAQAPSIDPISPARAKELVSLLQSKKLEAFAVKDSSAAGRFVAVLLVPNVQLMVVSAGYERPSDVEYAIYTKDYMRAYVDLNSSVLSKDKVFVEDALCDGLKPGPSGGVSDAITSGTEKHVFDGDFADPKKRNQKKISQEDYVKAFSAADAKYTQFLTMLLDELKKS